MGSRGSGLADAGAAKLVCPSTTLPAASAADASTERRDSSCMLSGAEQRAGRVARPWASGSADGEKHTVLATPARQSFQKWWHGSALNVKSNF